jgi:uncharacterized membrane protein
LESIARRLKRNYVFIYGIIMIAWLLKVFMHAYPGITSVESFYSAFAVAQLPAWLNLGVFVVTICSITGLIVFVASRSAGEVSEFGSNSSLWRI